MEEQTPPKQEEHPNLNRGGTFEGAGRPKKKHSITSQIREFLEAEDGRMMKTLARSIVLNAAKGNQAAIKAVLDRVDGPVVQKVAITELTNEQLIALLEDEAEEGGGEEGA